MRAAPWRCGTRSRTSRRSGPDRASRAIRVRRDTWARSGRGRPPLASRERSTTFSPINNFRSVSARTQVKRKRAHSTSPNTPPTTWKVAPDGYAAPSPGPLRRAPLEPRPTEPMAIRQRAARSSTPPKRNTNAGSSPCQPRIKFSHRFSSSGLDPSKTGQIRQFARAPTTRVRFRWSRSSSTARDPSGAWDRPGR